MASADAFVNPRTIELHGQTVNYHELGEGPPLLLIHGISSSSESWSEVLPRLAERHTVIAPDLIGHGASAKPHGDYSLGAFASSLRDLLVALGHERATVVGHSLGGGIAMQFSYQFPERVDRLVLVDSGGLGREVHLMLRAATLPGANWVLPAIARTGALHAGASAARLLGRFGVHASPEIRGIADGFETLEDPDACRAFLHTARAIMDSHGQRVSAADRLYLAQHIPTLIIWGERDTLIPVAHGRAAHELMPASRLEVFEQAGHFPFRDDPARFVSVLQRFIDETEPATADPERLRGMLLGEVAA
jgi:pimeloyl-ACP methyl ester carboxylesterase